MKRHQEIVGYWNNDAAEILSRMRARRARAEFRRGALAAILICLGCVIGFALGSGV